MFFGLPAAFRPSPFSWSPVTRYVACSGLRGLAESGIWAAELVWITSQVGGDWYHDFGHSSCTKKNFGLILSRLVPSCPVFPVLSRLPVFTSFLPFVTVFCYCLRFHSVRSKLSQEEQRPWLVLAAWFRLAQSPYYGRSGRKKEGSNLLIS